MGKPKISVAIITYNLEDYIEQTIKSVLAQKIDYTFEIVVGDDCSTDNTRTILKRFKETYPDKIKLLLHSQNLGSLRNYQQTISACNGQYIAILDGDDLWIDESKLQNQIELLDASPEVSMSFTAAKRINEHNDKTENIRAGDSNRTFNVKDILLNNFVYTSSVVFRKKFLPAFPDNYPEYPYGDWPLWVSLAQAGPIEYINTVTTAYRIHDSGIYSSLDRIDQSKKSLKARQIMVHTLDENLKKYCYQSIFTYSKRIMYFYREQNNIQMVKRYARYLNCLINNHVKENVTGMLRIKYFKYYHPVVDKFIQSNKTLIKKLTPFSTVVKLALLTAANPL